MSTFDIKARFFGKAFQGNIYDLEAMRLLNENLGSLIQQLIAIHLGRNELADELKDQIKHSVAINKGVFEVSINFERNFYNKFGITGLGQDSISFSDSIARLFYSAISLRRHVAETKKNGSSIKILLNTKQGKDNRSVAINEQGNILLNHPKVLWAAQMTKDATDQILRSIDGENVSGFEVEGFSRPFVSNDADFAVLDQEKSDLVAIANFTGRLDNLFFSRQRGVVVSESDIFQIAWDDEIRNKLLNHADLDNVEFIAQPCIETHSLYGELVVYKILDCVAANVPNANAAQKIEQVAS